jgi:hypothetical protein
MRGGFAPLFLYIYERSKTNAKTNIKIGRTSHTEAVVIPAKSRLHRRKASNEKKCLHMDTISHTGTGSQRKRNGGAGGAGKINV